jgi:Na+/H+ antiporter NhaC
MRAIAERIRPTIRIACWLLLFVLSFATDLSAAESSEGSSRPDFYGQWISIIPAALALSIAIFARKLLLGLMLGVLAGSMLVTSFNPLDSIVAFGETYLWKQLVDEDHLRLFGFTLMMGAMVGLLSRSGAMQACIDRGAKHVGTRRKAQTAGWGMGLVLFFDDYANTMLLGHSLRPFMDKIRVSREKLAFIVDATSASVASVALVSTWVAVEVSLIDTCLTTEGITANAYGLFISSIAYRHYVLLLLVFVPMIALLRRDFGPMLRCEQDAIRRDDDDKQIVEAAKPTEQASGHWWIAVIPIAVLLCAFFVLLVLTGRHALEDSSTATIGDCLAEGNSYIALLYSTVISLITTFLLVHFTRALDFDKSKDAMANGAAAIVPSLTILWFAWSLSAVLGDIGCGEFISNSIRDIGLQKEWLPTAIFVVSALVSFATGTSFGTMALMMPLSISTAVKLIGGEPAAIAADPVFVATIGSVLAGSVFGDHCSPISDTTVLSSQASGCDHLAHVNTQLPYALTVAGVSIVFGTIPAGFGMHPLVCLVAGIVALVIIVRVVGREI